MKLYFMPGACSLAVHIALREAGLSFRLIHVDYATRQTELGGDYHKINFKGQVPALALDNGHILTEVPVILQFIDGLAPEAGLLPASGLRRWRALEWLNYIATEIHKSFSPLFRRGTPEAFLGPGRAHLCRRLVVIEQHLSNSGYLAGTGFSLADVYLFTVCRWLKDMDLSIADWPAMQRHFNRIERRPAVIDASLKEGLVR